MLIVVYYQTRDNSETKDTKEMKNLTEMTLDLSKTEMTLDFSKSPNSNTFGPYAYPPDSLLVGPFKSSDLSNRSASWNMSAEDQYEGTFELIDSPTQTSTSVKPDGNFCISYSDLEFYQVLGFGSFGKVWKGFWKGCDVAIKVCDKPIHNHALILEAKVLASVPQHPNIVPFFGVAHDDSKEMVNALVMDYFPGGSVDSSFGSLSQHEKIDILRQAAAGVAHLHSHKIIHRDLACRNLLMLRTGVAIKVVVSDFGFSRTLDKEATAQTKNSLGPVRWMAPEAITSKQYSALSDVWSFGAVIFELMEEQNPHSHLSNSEVYCGIMQSDLFLTPSDNWPPMLSRLLKRCYVYEMNKRLCMPDVRDELLGMFC